MLEANPNLTYRDVQEILVRSARQNALLETPSSGALSNPVSTWQTNQASPFQNVAMYSFMAMSLREIGFGKIAALVEKRHVKGFRAGIGQRIAKIQLRRVADHLAVY